MATPFAGDLRNFAIVGHASSGKTMLSEAMLACAGVIGRMGNIAQGPPFRIITSASGNTRFPRKLRCCIARGWARN